MHPSSRFVEVAGLRTHYLEAGRGHPIVLLHSGEFGACAELSWEFTIGPLSEHFRVLAPDWLGFGHSEKVFNFEDMRAFRLRHLAAWLQALEIEAAHFVGNSMGGGHLAAAAAHRPCPLPIVRMVLAGAGGPAPLNAARELLNAYNGTRTQMRQVVEVLIRNPDLRQDEAYVDRRHQLSLETGAWEATAAARLKMPGRLTSEPTPNSYDAVDFPTLIITGADDPLRNPGFGEELQRQIRGSELLVIPGAGHCPQLDAPYVFNDAVISFLS